MAEISWVQMGSLALGSALGSGLTLKALDILHQHLRQRSERARSTKQFVNDHLDPVLKAADELVGKLCSLAEGDFGELPSFESGMEAWKSPNFTSLLYLFARFWAHVEIFRREGLCVALGEDERGERLKNFFDCLESRRVRIVDRISQRAVGEVTVDRRGVGNDTISFVEFVKAFESDSSDVRPWVLPLARILSRTRHTREKQQLLLYGVILHALIDTLDPGHLVTRDRPSYPNKLTQRTWTALRYRVIGQYLPFIDNWGKYLGLQKK